MKKQIITAAVTAMATIGIMAAAALSGIINISFSEHDAHAGETGDDGHGHAKAPSSSVKPQEEHHEDKEAAITLTPKQRRHLDIQIAETKKGSLDNFLQLPGEIQLNMDRTARLMPQMPGFVTEVPVSQGEQVKKGQVLAKITSHKLGEYYSDYNTAYELETVTKSELDMAKKLYEQKSVSQKDYLRYKQEYANAVIAREKAEALLKSLDLTSPHRNHIAARSMDYGAICTQYEIKAPFDGTVLKKDVTVGENFAEDNTREIFLISDMSSLWFDMRADAQEIASLSVKMPVTIRLPNSDRIYSGEIIYIAPTLDEDTRTGLVRVSIENPDSWIRSGAFATGTVKITDRRENILIPASAVQLVAGERVVFIPAGDGFSSREVEVGKSENGYTQILAGLAEGEKYVARGAFELKAVQMLSGMTGDGHGHAH